MRRVDKYQFQGRTVVVYALDPDDTEKFKHDFYYVIADSYVIDLPPMTEPDLTALRTAVEAWIIQHSKREAP